MRTNTFRNDGSATMQDVADKLGISVATVSRALRRVPGINPHTRSKVVQAATDLGYCLSRSYRNPPLDKDTLKHIGIFIATNLEHSPPAYLTGLIESSVHLNASPVIHYVKPGECESILDPARQPCAMRSGLLSGAVLIYWWPEKVLRELSSQMPITSIMYKYPGIDIDMVGVDHDSGMRLLVHQLYKLGHREIGFFGHCSAVDWSTARLGGYASALTGIGLPFRQKNVIEVKYEDLTTCTEATWGTSASRAEAQTRKGVTAWICSTEPGGWHLHNQLVQSGFRIPDDVSLTGFHRPSGKADNYPDLTSISVSCEAIGSTALHRLLHRIQNPLETHRSILFPFEFYRGTTIGPAKEA